MELFDERVDHGFILALMVIYTKKIMILLTLKKQLKKDDEVKLAKQKVPFEKYRKLGLKIQL